VPRGAARGRAACHRLRRDRRARRPRAARAAGVLRTASKSGGVAVTQDELYATLDLELSWSEAALPERVRTKHVHRLHPYHGKFIPQLVETLLDRYLVRGDHVLDPFAGSGTTLVQALESGLDATGVDIAAFNCLLMRVKTAPYDLAELGEELRDVATRVDSLPRRGPRASGYLRQWYAPRAAAELLAFRELIPEYRHGD